MNGYFKVTAALAAFMMLLVVMGLSTQGAVQAQQAEGTIGVANKYVCSDSGGTDSCSVDNRQFVIVVGAPTDGDNENELTINSNAEKNTVAITSAVDITVHVVADDSGETDTDGSVYYVEAYSGEKISVSYNAVTADNFAAAASVTVDNDRPTLVENSPLHPLITSDGTNITFNAEIIDSGAGFVAKAADIHSLEFGKGSIEVIVAGVDVDLKESNFTAVDGGFAVSFSVSSSILQTRSVNVPWFFRATDRAGNISRSAGTISGKTTAETTNTGTTISDDNSIFRYSTFASGDAENDDASPFSGARIKVTDKDGNSATRNLASWTRADGTGVTFTVDRAFFTHDDDDNDVTPEVGMEVPSGAAYEIVGVNLITVDSEEPTVTAVQTGTSYDAANKKERSGTDGAGKTNAMVVRFADTGRALNAAVGSGLDSSSVSESDFAVGGNSVEDVRVVRNNVYLTLGQALGSSEKPLLTIPNGAVFDKAGNAYNGGRFTNNTPIAVADGLGPNIDLTTSASLTQDKITLNIGTDENGPNPEVWVTSAAANGAASITVTGSDPAMDRAADGTGRSTAQRTYTYSTSTALADGEYSVVVRAQDSQQNVSQAGSATTAAATSAVTFEIDSQLNGGSAPKVSVADIDDVSGGTSRVQQVDPLIITLDFEGEAGEYARDSYKTVTLTSAKLKVTAGTVVTNIPFNLTTDVTTPDNVKFTIPWLNPKLGTYELTFEASDQAGNTEVLGSDEIKVKWTVIAPVPVDIKLAPGWNLVSLPFQPANPAINSVIPADHPADIVMTFDNASQVWMVSRRDAETGLFVGDIPLMTASTAYFIQTENFQAIRMLRPPLATAAAAPPPPPAITVVEGWNLVPVVSNDVPTPDGVAADGYFGTLGANGWLKALTFETLARRWVSVTPAETMQLGPTDDNPCTGGRPDPADVAEGTEPCQVAVSGNLYSERSSASGDVRVGDVREDAFVVDNNTVYEANTTVEAGDTDITDGGDGHDDEFDGNDKVTISAAVEVGKGYWLYATKDGVIIP